MNKIKIKLKNYLKTSNQNLNFNTIIYINLLTDILKILPGNPFWF
jgi:hypothetical protein